MADQVHYNPPVFYLPNFLGPYARRTRSIRSLFRDPLHSFQNLFSPMSGMSRNFFSSMGSMMDMDSDTPPNEGTFDHMIDLRFLVYHSLFLLLHRMWCAVLLHLSLLSKWHLDREMQNKKEMLKLKFLTSWIEELPFLTESLKERGHFVKSATSIFLSLKKVLPPSVLIERLTTSGQRCAQTLQGAKKWRHFLSFTSEFYIL